MKVSNAGAIARGIKKTLNDITKDKRLLKDIGEAAVKTVVGQAKQGKNPDGSPFENIGGGWDARRKRLATINPTDQFYKPSSKKSRTSFTGALLRSIKYSISKDSVIVKATGNHKGYRYLNGKRGKTVSNEKIVAGQKAQGRQILGTSRLLEKLVISLVQRATRRHIAKFNKRV